MPLGKRKLYKNVKSLQLPHSFTFQTTTDEQLPSTPIDFRSELTSQVHAVDKGKTKSPVSLVSDGYSSVGRSVLSLLLTSAGPESARFGISVARDY